SRLCIRARTAADPPRRYLRAAGSRRESSSSSEGTKRMEFTTKERRERRKNEVHFYIGNHIGILRSSSLTSFLRCEPRFLRHLEVHLFPHLRRQSSEQKWRVAEPVPALRAFPGTTKTPQTGSRTRPTLSCGWLSRL